MPAPYLVGVDRPLSSGNGSDDAPSGSTIPLPPHRTGDILIVGVAHTQPAEAANVAVSGFTRKIDHQNGNHSFQIWWRRAVSDDETGPTITHTFGGAPGTFFHSWEAVVATGCVASGDPFDVIATQNTSGGTHTGPSVTTTVNNCGILLVAASLGTSQYETWTNATIAPREIADVISDKLNHDMALGMAWGHMATAGATGTWTVTLTVGTGGGSTGTLALKPNGTGLATTQASYRDSTLTSEPATGTQITLPTHAAGDQICIAICGTDQAKTDAATLSGFTKRGRVELDLRAAAITVFTLNAVSPTETNPTITHTFGGSDDWVVIAFSVPGGKLISWQRESSAIAATIIGNRTVEAASPALIVGICVTNASVTFTSCTFADAGAATEREDGGPTAFKGALYTVEMAAAGWIGVPTWVISASGVSKWLTLAFAGTTIVTAATIPTINLSVLASGGAPSTGFYIIAIDWDNDGDFIDPFDEVSPDVLDQPGIRFNRGRDRQRTLQPAAATEAGFLLDNTDRRYSPENAASPIFGKMLPGRPLHIRALIEGTLYNLWRGFVADYDALPDSAKRWVQITGFDSLSRLVGKNISTRLYEGIDVGAALNVVLDEAGWPAGFRDIQAGATIIPWWWEDETDAFTAVIKLVNSEGPGAVLYVDPDLRIVFRNRHHRYLNSRSLNVQATFRDIFSGTDFVYSDPLVYDDGHRDIINDVTIPVDIRAIQPTEVVWRQQSLLVPASTSVSVNARASNPFKAAIVPLRNTDYFADQGAAAVVALSRTSGQSTIITFTAAPGPDLILRDLQLRAQPVEVVARSLVAVNDTTSITKYGKRSYPYDAPWLDLPHANDIATALLAAYKEPRQKVSMLMENVKETALPSQLTLEISDRFRIVDTELGMDRHFFLEGTIHEISGVSSHRITYECEVVDTPLVPVGDLFIFDSATQGKFDTNKLGY